MIEITAKKTYGERVVLDINSLQLVDGKRYAVIGANGSGKSTLLRGIAGIINLEGEIKNPCDDLVYMPQNNYAFSLSVQNNVLLSFRFSERKKHITDADNVMKKLELYHLKNKNASRLSGGETQRVALARVLMVKHSVIVLDEPTSSMDINSALTAEKEILEYCQDNKSTLIFATHSLKQASRLADEVIFMKEGKIIEKGEPNIILTHPQRLETKAFINYNL